jgi:hypothetical protein
MDAQMLKAVTLCRNRWLRPVYEALAAARSLPIHGFSAGSVEPVQHSVSQFRNTNSLRISLPYNCWRSRSVSSAVSAASCH